MSQLHFSWIELSVLSPLVGAAWVALRSDAEIARRWSVVFSGVTLLAAAGAWLDFQYLQAGEAADRFSLITTLVGWQPLVIDRLSAPLLPLIALLFFLAQLATVHGEAYRFSFTLGLLAESITMATYGCKDPWTIVGLLAVGATLPLADFRVLGRSSRAYCFYLALFVGLMVAGQYDLPAGGHVSQSWAPTALAIAMMIRAGIVPFHSWIPDLFERVAFGTALLFVAPLVGAYGLMRLVLPVASDDLLGMVSLLAMVTAFYASAMALIQREGRQFFSFLLISNGAIVVAGLLATSHSALVGGLCVWLSVTISVGGLGLTLRALEARRGRLHMNRFQGLYDHTPNLAICFAMTGLASVGFPGTFGFIGTELLVDGSVESQPFLGIVLVIVAAMNGIAIMQAFLRLFGGARYFSSVSLAIRPRERYAVMALALLILLGGLFPQWVVASRSQAADDVLEQRHAAGAKDEQATADARTSR